MKFWVFHFDFFHWLSCWSIFNLTGCFCFFTLATILLDNLPKMAPIGFDLLLHLCLRNSPFRVIIFRQFSINIWKSLRFFKSTVVFLQIWDKTHNYSFSIQPKLYWFPCIHEYSKTQKFITCVSSCVKCNFEYVLKYFWLQKNFSLFSHLTSLSI